MTAVCYLGIDLGTSSVKALVLDPAGQPLGIGRSSAPVTAPRPGWSESDPLDWWEATCQAVREAISTVGSRPVAVGLSGQMHGVVLCDARAHPTRPAVLWPDLRAVEQLKAYRALPAEMLARLANPLSPGMAGPMLRWVAAHEPAAITTARWALQPKDWLRLRLTGTAYGEPSDASGTLLYDVLGDDWDTEAMASLGLDPRLLPPLVPSGSVAGTLTADAAADLGLDADIPVAAGAADTAAAAVGTGLVVAGSTQLTVGTGGQLVTPQSRPAPAPDDGVQVHRTATSSGWYALAATLNAGLALDRVRHLLGVDWSSLYASADEPFADDDPIFLPHLVGERTPHLEPRLRGGWLDIGVGHDRSALLQAALEGVAFALREALDVLPGSTGPLRMAGGGSAAAAWRQLLADVLDRELHASDVTDASARGAALLAIVATGAARESDLADRLAPPTMPVAYPRPEAVEHRAARFTRFRAATAALHHVRTDDHRL